MNLLYRLGLDKKFATYWKRYALQSACAGLTILVLMLILHLQGAAALASMGASTFIVFAMPKSVTARPRNIVIGHTLGLCMGLLYSLLPQTTTFFSAFVYALAVGSTMFLMVATNTEHPPAGGTALAVAMSGWQPDLILSLLVSVALLALIRGVLGSRLLNLV